MYQDSAALDLLNIYNIYNSSRNPYANTVNEYYFYFENDGLIRKIITLFPDLAFKNGYVIKGKNGETLYKNDQVILEGFHEATIIARLTGKCMLIVDDGADLDMPLRNNAVDYLIPKNNNFTRLKNDYYKTEFGDIHKSKVLKFIGLRSYKPGIKDYDDLYAYSILKPAIDSVMNYIKISNHGESILRKLSYLLFGMRSLGSTLSSTDGFNKILERIRTVQYAEDSSSPMAYDLENEDVKFISQTLSGFDEIVENAKQKLLMNTEYTSDELYGTARTQSLGSGIQNQLIARFLSASRIASWANTHWSKNMIMYYQNLGLTDFAIEFPTNMELSDNEKMELEKLAAERSQLLVNMGAITPEEVRRGYTGEDFDINLIVQNESAKVPRNEIIVDSELTDSMWRQLSNVNFNDVDSVMEEALE